jgi:hypothetical protein
MPKAYSRKREIRFEIGQICTIVANNAGHQFEIGSTVVIWTILCDGYKAVQGTKLPLTFPPETEAWWYVDIDDVEEYNA